MPDLTATHPGRHHPPAIPSNLRNEVTAEYIDNAMSDLQVPDSQVCIPETQFDLHSEDFPHDDEYHRERIGGQESVRPNKEGASHPSRHQAPKKNTSTMDFTFGATPLARPKAKPKATEQADFSPYSQPNPAIRSTGKAAPRPILNTTAEIAQMSSPAVQNSAFQSVDGAPASEHNEQNTSLEGSVVQQTDNQDNYDSQGSPVEGNPLVTPAIGMNNASSAIPSITVHGSPNREGITEQFPTQQDHPAERTRSERRPKGKKTKKGPKLKARRPDTAVAWPPKSQYAADHGCNASGNDHTAQDQVSSNLHESETPSPTYEHRMPEHVHRVHHPEDVHVGRPEQCNGNLKFAQSQDGPSPMCFVGDVEPTPDPTPAVLNNETEPQTGSYVSPVLPVQHCNEADVSGSYDPRCLENSPMIISGHNESKTGSFLHNTYDHRGPQPVLHDPCSNQETNMTTNDGYNLENNTHDMSQTEGFAVHPGVHRLQGQAGEFSADTGSSQSRRAQEFQDSVLHAKSGQDSSDRIRKPRSKKRVKGFSALPSLQNIDGAALSNTTDHEVILNMMAMCLRAGDNKARNIVDTSAKAHEAAVASLQETIVQQNCFIQNLQAQNDTFRGREQKISDSTTRLQKYVKGMEGDYNRLKGQTEAHRKISDKLVKDAIHKLEQEKSGLEHDFLQTVEVLSTSQRHMRAAMNDCFSQLMLSESNHRSVSKQLQKLTADYDEEKKKRSDLEQHILLTVQAIQTSLDENHRVILEKAGDVQGAVGDNSSKQHERDIHLKECLDALRSLRSVAILTTNDVRKAEALLQSIHASMSSKMSLITQTVEKIQDPTEDIQSYLRNQLATLRADVLRYEEVSEDRQKTQQWNEQLHQQLETQKEQCAMLHESIRNSQQEAADVKAQYSSLQSELENWKGKSCNHDADPSEADKERDNLRKQLEKAKEDLREELTELGRVQQRLESQAEELTTTKVTLKEKDAAYQEEISKLKQERDGQHEILRELRTERDKLTGDLRLFESKISEMASEAEKLRQADNETRKELQKAQSAAKEASSTASKLTNLKSQVEKRSKETQSAIDEVTALSSQLTILKQQMAQKSAVPRSQEELEKIQADHTRLVHRAAGLAQEKEQLKNQVDEHASTISALKEEIHIAHQNKENNAASLRQLRSGTGAMQREKDQLTSQMSVDQSRIEELKKELDTRKDTHRKDIDALKELQRRVEQMQEEKQDLATNLGRSRANESKLSEAQAVYSTEKEGIQLEIAILKASLEAKENEVRHAQTQAMQNSQTMAENHSAETDNLKRRINRIETALRAADKLAEHRTRELEAHKKATSEKYQKLVLEAQRPESIRGLELNEEPSNEVLIQDSRPRVVDPMHAGGVQPQHSHSITDSVAHDEESFDATVAKARKKPIRLNTTVLNVAEASRSQATLRLRLPDPRDERLHEQDEDDDETSIIGARGMLDKNGVSFFRSAAEESQEPQSHLDFSVGDFNDSMRAMTESKRPETSSSVLSEPPSSDDLIDMGPLEKGTVQDNSKNDYGHFGAGKAPHDSRYHETSRNSLNGVSSITQDRPKSQANTGSRMLPPPTPTGPSTRDYPPPTKAVRRVPSRSVQSGRVGSGNARSSSPGFLRRPTSNRKTYGNNSAGLGTGEPSETLRASVNGPTMKRKGPGSRAPENLPSKRRRSSSRLSSAQSIPSSQPDQISQPQSQGPYVAPTPRGRRSKGRKRNDEFDAMFDRELQTGRSRRMR